MDDKGSSMTGFPGFPDGNLKATPVPDLFFSDLLPLVDNLLELKVTLHCLWLYRQKGGETPCVSAAELEEDELLSRSLLAGAAHEILRYAQNDSMILRAPPGRPLVGRGPQNDSMIAREALHEGLERAVGRGTLLQVNARDADGREQTWYLMNSERGRAAVARLERGEWVPEGASSSAHLEARRPNIFNLYEQNLGLIQSAMLAEELIDAERTYPAEWIEEAFRIAVGNNVRRWAYVRRILERWAEEGRGPRPAGQDEADRERFIKGEYADYVKH
jgi:DNA replication protein